MSSCCLVLEKFSFCHIYIKVLDNNFLCITQIKNMEVKASHKTGAERIKGLAQEPNRGSAPTAPNYCS